MHSDLIRSDRRCEHKERDDEGIPPYQPRCRPSARLHRISPKVQRAKTGWKRCADLGLSGHNFRLLTISPESPAIPVCPQAGERSARVTRCRSRTGAGAAVVSLGELAKRRNSSWCSLYFLAASVADILASRRWCAWWRCSNVVSAGSSATAFSTSGMGSGIGSGFGSTAYLAAFFELECTRTLSCWPICKYELTPGADSTMPSASCGAKFPTAAGQARGRALPA